MQKYLKKCNTIPSKKMVICKCLADSDKILQDNQMYWKVTSIIQIKFFMKF